MKVYDTDPLVPYKSTNINAARSKQMIEGTLAEYGIIDYGWRWHPKDNHVILFFGIDETLNGKRVTNRVRIEAPLIYHKATKKTSEYVNWDVSLRVVYWYVLTHLQASYVLGRTRLEEFLPNVVLSLKDGSERRLGEVLAVNGHDLETMAKALPEKEILT